MALKSAFFKPNRGFLDENVPFQRPLISIRIQPQIVENVKVNKDLITTTGFSFLVVSLVKRDSYLYAQQLGLVFSCKSSKER